MLDLNTMARLGMQERERAIAMHQRQSAALAASPDRPHLFRVVVARITRVLARRQSQPPSASVGRAPAAQ